MKKKQLKKVLSTAIIIVIALMFVLPLFFGHGF